MELYVNQGHCKQMHKLIAHISETKPWPELKKPARQIVLEELFSNGRSKEIANRLYMDIDYVKGIVSEALSILRTRKWK